MRATITPTPSGLGVAVLAAAGLLAAQACGAGGSDPGEGNGNGQATEDKNDEAGLQEIEFGALTFRVPEEWEPHDMEYSQMPMGGGEEAHDEWLLVQTNPEEECDLDAGITPGEDYGCAHVMLLGPGSIAVGHGLGELSEDNPFALGTNPGPCAEGIETGLEEPANPANRASPRTRRSETRPSRTASGPWPVRRTRRHRSSTTTSSGRGTCPTR